MNRLAVLTYERRVRAAVIRQSTDRHSTWNQVFDRPEWHPWARRLEDLAAVIHHTRTREVPA